MTNFRMMCLPLFTETERLGLEPLTVAEYIDKASERPEHVDLIFAL
jgi:hypothetical protein